MSKRMILADALLLTAIWYVAFAAPAQAYFDLGTGTYLFQLVFGFGAAFLLSFKSQLMKMLPRRRGNDTAQPIAAPVDAPGSESQ